jgi:pSer/pThr/pTyr-binding forkhead associated (FHA) protein
LLAAILLYAFAGWSFYLMWRTLRAQSIFSLRERPAQSNSGMVSGSGKCTLPSLRQSDFFIGRDPDCELLLDDTAVSARHVRGCLITTDTGGPKTAGSKNGTVLNDAPLSMPTILANGDTIVCGDTSLDIILPE